MSCKLPLDVITSILMQLPHEEVFPDLCDNYKAIPIFLRSYTTYRSLILERHIAVNNNDETFNGKCVTYRIGGKLHRDGGLPAQVYASGNKVWYVNGLPHRDGGLPAVEHINGDKRWYVNGKRHRDGGLPAIEYGNGHNEWWVNGNLHREGGLPAIECANGYMAWFVDGKHIKK